MAVAPFAGRQFNNEYRAIRTSRYTYVRKLDGPWLLYDDVKDPCQLDNLAAKPENAALCNELDRRLKAQLKKIGDDFRPARAHIEEWGYNVRPGDSLSYAPDAKPQTPHRQATAKPAKSEP